jgi:hypothetical protein
MSVLILAMVVVQGLGITQAFAASSRELLGRWQYDGFLYEGHRYPNPNPDLDLTFTFLVDGKSRLSWLRKNDGTFCERIADYQVVEEHLLQKVTWVNPKNASECRADSDMQLGQETDTVISIEEPELTFFVNLNGKPFLYILKRTFPSRP